MEFGPPGLRAKVYIDVSDVESSKKRIEAMLGLMEATRKETERLGLVAADKKGAPK